MTLAALVSPMAEDRFLSEFDDRAPVLLATDREPALRLRDVDTLVTGGALRWPTFHLRHGDEVAHVDTYTHAVSWGSGVEGYLARPDAVCALVASGHTLQLDQLHRQQHAIAALVRSYEQAFHWRADGVATLEPNGAVARAPRYTLEHRFVHQCVGSQRWRIFAPLVEKPLAHEACDKAGCEPVGEPVLDLTLAPGGVLYIPRGFVAVAVASETAVLTVTVNVKPVTLYDLVGALVRRFDDPLLHDSVRLDLSAPDQTSPEQRLHFEAIVEELLASMDPEETLESMADSFVATRLPALRGLLVDQRSSGTIGDMTLLQRRPGLMVRIIDTPEAVELRFHGKRVRLRAGRMKMARFLVDQPSFRVHELPEIPNMVNRLNLARHLLSEGFLAFV